MAKLTFGSSVTCGTSLSFIAILIALYCQDSCDIFKWLNFNNTNTSRQLSVLNGLLELEEDNLVASGINKPRVAVGYGACVDLFVNATDLLEKYSLPGVPGHFDEIQNDQQFLQSFAYYFKHGAAAERFMTSGHNFNKWVKEASKIPTARWALGGNAPVMASRFFKEGCDVLIAAKMTEKLKSTIDNDIKVTGGTNLEKDDIHLIMEYATDDVWSDIKTPRANRYIVHNDQNNPTVSSLEDFDKMLPEFRPHLVIVSGLQMMDNYPFKEGVRESRLNAIKTQMINHGKKSRMHFEMASFVEQRLLKNLMDYIIPYSDSLGMNEQELTNLYSLYLHGEVTHVADFNPRVATVLDQTRQLYKMIHNSSKNIKDSKKLTRIHVHTLAYQAILTEQNSEWKRSKAAAAKASLTANRHVCADKNIDVAKSKLILDNSFSLSTKAGSRRIHVTDEQPVSCWDEQILLDGNEKRAINICIAPVLVCTEAKQTAGCGDNISSAGLVLQI